MVEGKLRKLSQCSSAFLTAINGVISKLTTTTYTVQQVTNADLGASIQIKATTGNNEPGLVMFPSGTGSFSAIEIGNDTDSANCGVLEAWIDTSTANIDSKKTGTGTILPLHLLVGANDWAFSTAGKTTFPGLLGNTAIADPAAAAGQLWLSSTNANNLKYSSASTLYTIKSTLSATNTATAAAPTATTSATAVMMACGGAITPANTGRILITASGQMANDTVNDGVTVDLRFGSGTPPINGAAVTGTLVGLAQTSTSLTAAEKDGFCISGIVTGATLGTALWIDLSLLRVTGGSASLTGVTISAVEV